MGTNMKIMRSLIPVILLGALTACSTTVTRTPASDSTVSLHFISTTDVHGYILSQRSSPKAPSSGGIDLMQGYFNIAKSQDPDTILLDSGDLFQGTIISNTSDGATVVKWMNEAGYTAAAIGNHDFDFGPGNGSSQVTSPGQDPLGALKARIADAHFKFLSANICSVDEDSAQCANPVTYKVASFTQPYLIKAVHGVKVGIIGLTTTTTPETTLPANVTRLRFMPLASTLERFVPLLKQQGVDTIVVVAHEGGFCDHGQCSPTDPIFQAIDLLAPATRAAIPVIFAGHTHNFLNTVYNGVHVMINGSYGRSFGYATLTVQNPGTSNASVTVDAKSYDFCSAVYPDTQNCTKGRGKPVPATFLGQTVAADPSALTVIASDIERANALGSQVVGKLVTPVTFDYATPESTLGELMADSLRFCKTSACTDAADVSFQNNGGIRSKEIDAGNVTYQQVFQTDPFDDYYSELSLKGSQVRDLLVTFYSYNHGSFGQYSGLQITYSKSKVTPRTVANMAGGSKVLPDPIVKILMSDGTPLQDDKIYRIAMVDFLATGGGGTAPVLTGLQPPPSVHLDRVMKDVILDYFKANPTGLDYSKLGGGRLIEEP